MLGFSPVADDAAGGVEAALQEVNRQLGPYAAAWDSLVDAWLVVRIADPQVRCCQDLDWCKAHTDRSVLQLRDIGEGLWAQMRKLLALHCRAFGFTHSSVRWSGDVPWLWWCKPAARLYRVGNGMPWSQHAVSELRRAPACHIQP